jgi:hypothetical protein
MILRIVTMFTTSVMVGVAVSSFRHYYHRFADEEDLKMIDQREVVIVDDLTKKTRGRKK